MKNLLLFFFLASGATCFSQSEFGESGNGLLYPDSTIRKLKVIVDSLNIKYKDVKPSKTHFSKYQAKAHYILLQSDVKAAKKDLDAGISFDAFTAKYPDAISRKDLLVIKHKYKEDGKDVTLFQNIELWDGDAQKLEFKKNVTKYDQPLKAKWVYEYYPEKKDNGGFLEAFYFLEELTQTKIPEKYAALVSYADCMVDTSAQVYYDTKYYGSDYYTNTDKVNEFLSYANKATVGPAFNYKDSKVYTKQPRKPDYSDPQVWVILDSLKKNDAVFNNLFSEALKDSLPKGLTDNEFESFAGRYHSKKLELELKRRRIVYGSCSQDARPRIHAFNIARLAAETMNWEIFLRSYLDIMNDHFARMSDLGITSIQRSTYIKELELIDVHIFELLAGISLRLENPCKNHYYGSTFKIGKALSEAAELPQYKAKMLEMIADKELDPYNRYLICYIYTTCNTYTGNDAEREESKKKLTESVKAMPDYLAEKVIGHQ